MALSSNQFYNTLWEHPHEIPHKFITKINDFATMTVLDLHVGRRVTKLHDATERVDLRPRALERVRATLNDFWHELKPDDHVWNVDEVGKFVDALWLHLQPDLLREIVADKNIQPLKKQIARYLYAVNNKYYNIVPDDRFGPTGVMVLARKNISIGQEISYLNMCMSEDLSDDEYEALGSGDKDKPVGMYGFRYPMGRGRRNEWKIACGPMMYVNHSCDPNCVMELYGGDMVRLRAAKPINGGDEITWTYSPNHFKKDCLCPKHKPKVASKTPTKKRSATESEHYTRSKHSRKC
ncbi:hypothetical protein HA402_014806 [Bradysia odoriphaga]|nr:hypothetical protein HA402_014806 [Bradysia odoriphaga]